MADEERIFMQTRQRIFKCTDMHVVFFSRQNSKIFDIFIYLFKMNIVHKVHKVNDIKNKNKSNDDVNYNS